MQDTRTAEAKEADRAAHMTEEEKSAYHTMLEEYKFCAQFRAGARWVNYDIIADLVKAGWRRSAQGDLPKRKV